MLHTNVWAIHPSCSLCGWTTALFRLLLLLLTCLFFGRDFIATLIVTVCGCSNFLFYWPNLTYGKTHVEKGKTYRNHIHMLLQSLNKNVDPHKLNGKKHSARNPLVQWCLLHFWIMLLLSSDTGEGVTLLSCLKLKQGHLHIRFDRTSKTQLLLTWKLKSMFFIV